MKRKIIGIVICTLVITAIGIPMAGSMKTMQQSISPDSTTENFQHKGGFSKKGSNLDNRVTTPSIDISGLVSPYLEIKTLYEILPKGDVDYGHIRVSENGGSTWTTLESIQGYTKNEISMEVSLTNITGNIIIAFDYETGSGSISDGWWIFEIFVKGSHEIAYHEDFSEYNVGDSWGEWVIGFQAEVPNAPPDNPHITGSTNSVPGANLTYKFITTDPDGDDVYYYIDWGDDTPDIEWDGPHPSGTTISKWHTFEEGTYDIKCKAKDIYDEEGKWGTLHVSMPKNKITNKQLLLIFLERFIERFPLLEKILSLN